MRRGILTTIVACTTLVVTGCSAVATRDLASYKQDNAICYDRDTEPYTSVVDSHIHFRPFGGEAVPFEEVKQYFSKTGVLFANVYGIGQILPVDSDCTYYLNCPGTDALPSIKNDFINAANLVEFKSQGIQLTLSMTFPDLANPDGIVQTIELYDKEYPKMFRWLGEVNLIKQALLNNGHKAATKENIEQWTDFMRVLRERKIPINIHSDLGNDQEPTKYLELMEYVLELYPDNKIVWAHMGLSKELTKISAEDHIKIMQSFLDKSPNLMLDISWRVLYDNFFSKAKEKALYVTFFKKHSDRILPGTDFVASRDKTLKTYKDELEVVSRINQDLDDEAFRNIALGENYFRLLNMDYEAPQICQK
ncbi:MAG: amidohydrolase [SAR324 cluster bacterium]|uniref:Amidohydrolase n=1 Tax=SAR324 cluster bacterium TaxID=2024889 RepID=A0A2A4T831_9DELT|nr:MAG: amidohydrolase [SAR324 cluster bacterium]